MRKNINLYPIFLVIIQGLIVLIFVEWVYRGNFQALMDWFELGKGPVIYNYLILLLLFGSLMIFKRKISLVLKLLTTGILIIFALACNIKQEIRGIPVLPSDLILRSEAKNMLDFVSNELITWIIAGILIVILIIVIIIFKVPNELKRNRITFPISILISCFFILFVLTEIKNDDTILKNKFNIINLPWDQKATYEHDGVMTGFLLNLKWLSIEKPANYSKEAIQEINKNVQQPKFADSEKPDIIVIMSEAFWDPTFLENVKFNRDPLSYFHQIATTSSSGRLSVPVFGGNTVNTEFEVLTGISTQLLPVGSIPYLNYIKKPISALPNILRNNGYDTTAIHTYHNWFYQRATVYKNLGFDKFISLEFTENPIHDVDFLHDKTITNEILKKINDGDKPKFIFAVTMHNHGPYSETLKKQYASVEVGLDNQKNGFSEEAENILEVYSDNLVEIDMELQRLVSELEKSNRKSILVFFGDHLPLLGNDYKVYRESKYFQENNTYQEYLKMYSTPYVIWDNFSGITNNQDVGASLLPSMILNRAEISGNSLTNYLYDKFKEGKFSRIIRQDFFDNEVINNKTLKEIKLLQYDLLFGKMFSINNKKELQPSNSYRLGYKDPEIMDVQMKTINGRELLVVTGENFTENCFVYLNGEYYVRESGNSEEIIISIPKIKGEQEVIVKIVDSNEKTLASSNTFIFN